MEDASEQLDTLARNIGDCTRCEKLVASRLRAVPGGGHPHCAVMVVSLSPSPTDEAAGGPAGSTTVDGLTEYAPCLAKDSDDLYVTTLLKCVPRSGRKVRAPTVAEMVACYPYLSRELTITTPHFLLTAGEATTRYLLAKLFRDLPYTRGDSLELRVFDNPSFRIVPVATPEELARRDAKARKGYAERLRALCQMMGL